MMQTLPKAVVMKPARKIVAFPHQIGGTRSQIIRQLARMGKKKILDREGQSLVLTDVNITLQDVNKKKFL